MASVICLIFIQPSPTVGAAHFCRINSPIYFYSMAHISADNNKRLKILITATTAPRHLAIVRARIRPQPLLAIAA